MFLPPSTDITALVIYDPAELASIKQGPTISSFLPTLPSGVRRATLAAAGKSVRALGSDGVGEGLDVISVRKVPGRMVLTRILSLISVADSERD